MNMEIAERVDELTELLRGWDGSAGAPSERLLALVYPELKRIAQQQLRRERRGHTLQATALVHEAWLRLVGQTRVSWRERDQFFAVASTVMRRVLVDYARARLAAKRLHEPVSLTAAAAVGGDAAAYEVLDLDRALERLANLYPRPARVVELRYFGGMDLAEIAGLLGVTDRTIKRDWSFARAWLARELGPERA